MTPPDLQTWLIAQISEQPPLDKLFNGFCRKLVKQGLPIWRANIGLETLHPEEIGMGLTESMAMSPAASVSGFYLSHPDSQYFNVGRIGEDQLVDQVQRRGADRAELQRLLAPNL